MSLEPIIEEAAVEEKILDYDRDWEKILEKLDFLPEGTDCNAWFSSFILYLVNLA